MNMQITSQSSILGYSPSFERKEKVNENDSSMPELLLKSSEVLVSPDGSPRVNVEDDGGDMIEKIIDLRELEVGIKIDQNTEQLVINNFEELSSVVDQLRLLNSEKKDWSEINNDMPQICCIDMQSLNVTDKIKGLVQELLRLSGSSSLKIGDIDGSVGRLSFSDCWFLKHFECGSIKLGVVLDCSKVSTLGRVKTGKIGGTLVLPLFGLQFTHSGIQETGNVLFGS